MSGLNALLDKYPRTPGVKHISRIANSFKSKRSNKLTFSILGNAETIFHFLKQSVICFSSLFADGYALIGEIVNFFRLIERKELDLWCEQVNLFADLSQETFTKSSLSSLKNRLQTFCSELSSCFGRENYRRPKFHIVHHHLIDLVVSLGPFWSFSTRIDESHHQILKRLIRFSTNGWNVSKDVLSKVLKLKIFVESFWDLLHIFCSNFSIMNWSNHPSSRHALWQTTKKKNFLPFFPNPKQKRNKRDNPLDWLVFFSFSEIHLIGSQCLSGYHTSLFNQNLGFSLTHNSVRFFNGFTLEGKTIYVEGFIDRRGKTHRPISGQGIVTFLCFNSPTLNLRLLFLSSTLTCILRSFLSFSWSWLGNSAWASLC